ncbi:MAG: type II secretion system minor pseudopilin GspJ [Pseudomonadota bacterium]
MRARHADGFTLVELLLAVALSAVIAALAYAGINSGMQAALSLETEVHNLTELQRALSIIEEDLLQVRLRPVMHGVDYREPALVSNNSADSLLEFTRGGFANPLQLPRSDLLRVRYVLRGGSLWREHWSQLDRVDALQTPQRVMLLSDVTGIELEFLAEQPGVIPDLLSLQEAGGAWQRYWDSEDPRTALTAPLPLAIRLTLTTTQYAQVQRVVELP